MASERRSARPPKVIKKEPSFAIASLGIAGPERDESAEWIAIDLAQALPGIAITLSMQIIIEGVPDGARFSSGRNNGDKTWSLDPEDLIGLGYLPPPGRGAEDQNFFVRLLTYDPDGYQIASTTAQVQVSVNGVTARRPVRLDRGEGESGAFDAIREFEFAQRLAEAEHAWQLAEAERIHQLEQAWHGAAEEQLRAAEEEWRQGEADRNRALHDQLVDLARRLREAETEWQQAESERISAALAQAADFTAQRFAAAEEQWRVEAERRVAEAEGAAQKTVAAARAELQAQLAAELKSKASTLSQEAEVEFEQRLEQVRTELEAQLESERSRLQSEADAARRQGAAETEARLRPELERGAAQLNELKSVLKELKEKAESARLGYERELSNRQHTWESERTALLAASSPDPAMIDRIAVLEEQWRAEADRLAQQAEARTRREAEQRLAEAEASWAEIAQRRIAEAQIEWEEAAQRQQAEHSASEAALSEQQHDAMRARMSEVERLAGEAERRVAERDRQLSEAIAIQDRLQAKIAEVESNLEEALQSRLAEAESDWRAQEEQRLAEAQQTWEAEQERRFLAAQSQWVAEEEERLQTAIAAERVILAGSDVGQMLNQAETRWREAEQDRLTAAETRWKMEEDQRVAAAVAAAREDMERMVEARLHRELTVDARRVVARSFGRLSTAFTLFRWSAAGAAAAAVAGVLYIAAPEIKALIPERGSAVAAAPPLLSPRPVAPALKALSLRVSAEFVNLRSQPSSDAPVMARLQRGTEVVASERRRNWVRVSAADGVADGWIHSSLLEGPLPPAN
ncbi:MAG TPA: SH3 domain-containing protein [Alphaproteobacteria bacterium]|nr:SH3 domain-containing protein [Alphaproteobacteria bacterium]